MPFPEPHIPRSHRDPGTEPQPRVRRLHVSEEHPLQPHLALADDLSYSLHWPIPHQVVREGLESLGEVLDIPLRRWVTQ